MKLNAAMCKSYILSILRVLLERVKSIVWANKYLITNHCYVLWQEKSTLQIKKFYLWYFIIIVLAALGIYHWFSTFNALISMKDTTFFYQLLLFYRIREMHYYMQKAKLSWNFIIVQQRDICQGTRTFTVFHLGRFT